MKMKTRLTIVIALLSIAAHASEESPAIVRKVEVTADTYLKPFNQVTVSAAADWNLGTNILTSLSATWEKTTFKIPSDDLSKIRNPNLATLRVWSEYGYPDAGIGPYLIIRMTGGTVKDPVHYTILFEATGFKKVNEWHPTKKSTVSENGDPFSEP